MPSKKSYLQFYADECFPVTSSTYLKSKGISVVHAYDINFIQKSDHFHLEQSKKMHKVLLTLDRDFIGFEEINLKDHPGVVVVSVGSATPPNVNRVLSKALKKISKDYVENSLIKITDKKIIKIKGERQTVKNI